MPSGERLGVEEQGLPLAKSISGHAKQLRSKSGEAFKNYPWISFIHLWHYISVKRLCVSKLTLFNLGTIVQI